jgi:hypothetical protein
MFKNRTKLSECLHAGIPWLFIDSLHERRAGEFFVLLEPAIGG